MSKSLQPVLSVLGRVMLVSIFALSAVGQKIPNFNDTIAYMQQHGVPFPHVALVAAIAFLVVGSALVILGWQARIGAKLLLIFLILATYYFHDFWTISDPQARQAQLIQFMKNVSMMGGMIFLIANGSGAGSLQTTPPKLP